jgi:spore germination protein Q
MSVSDESQNQDQQFQKGYTNNSYYPAVYSNHSHSNRQFQAQQPIPFTPQQQPFLPNQPVTLSQFPGTVQPAQATGMPTQLPPQQSYIENILRMNQGKRVRVLMTFEGRNQDAQEFNGVIEAAGRDHIILSDPETGERFLLLMVYLDYVIFDEKINYNPAFSGGAFNLAINPPR